MLAGEDDLARVQELYYQAFADYNRLLETHSTNSPEVRQALAKLQAAKAKVKELRRRLRQ
jgi:phosphoglycolate phosphatase-like HAD superfamily hydrolase